MRHTKPFYPYQPKRPLSDINVVPYIDVMLVLLVIFMVTTPLLSQGIKVDLPQAKAQTISQSQELLIVSIDESGRYYLNTAVHPMEPLDASHLSQALAQQLQLTSSNKLSRQVFVKGDSKVDYGKVVRAMVLLQKAGAAHIGLLTEPPPEPA